MMSQTTPLRAQARQQERESERTISILEYYAPHVYQSV